MDKKTVTTIAYLSRIALDEGNEDKITTDLENIIKFVDQLDNANVDGIEPLTNPLEKKAQTREDKVTAENRKDTFLDRAPKSNEDYFLVPRVVEWVFNTKVLKTLLACFKIKRFLIRNLLMKLLH